MQKTLYFVYEYIRTYVYIYIHVCIHTYIHTWLNKYNSQFVFAQDMDRSVLQAVCDCMQVDRCLKICIDIHAYVCMCMYVCMYVRLWPLVFHWKSWRSISTSFAAAQLQPPVRPDTGQVTHIHTYIHTYILAYQHISYTWSYLHLPLTWFSKYW